MLAIIRFVCFLPLFYALLDEPTNVMTRTLLRALRICQQEQGTFPYGSLNEVTDLNKAPDLPPVEKPVEVQELPTPFPTVVSFKPKILLLAGTAVHIPLLC
jgi:hypothetical protein